MINAVPYVCLAYIFCMILRWLGILSFGQTRVSLRGKGIAGSPEYRDAYVFYDNWNQPVVYENIFAPTSVGSSTQLYKDGRTSCGLWDVQWKHLSGPPVKFDIKETEW